MKSPIVISLILEDAARLEEWIERLPSPRRRVMTGCPAEAGLPDVIVADHNPLAELPAHVAEQLGDGQVGLVLLGCAGTADVTLPTDGTLREVRLATLLVAEIIRLRRQARSDHRANQVLKHLAGSDPLTGLPNRRGWDQYWKSVAASPGRRCVALFDVNNLKQINDQFGHLQGDRVLQHVAETLAQAAGSGDYVARLGGDEFVMVIEAAADEAGRRVRQICQQLKRHQDPHQQPTTAVQNVGQITTCVGLACTLSSSSDLVSRADAALCRAKQTGMDHLVIADDTDQERTT